MDFSATPPRLYGELADWFHLLTAPEDYAEEAAAYRQLLDVTGPVTTVLELGSGGGNNAVHLKRHYQLSLTDVSAAMLQLSRGINPDCEHVVGDMRSLRLEQTFDAVFIHDAVGYMATGQDLAAALETALVHLRSGGVALVCPDAVAETFSPTTRHGGHDGGTRGLRYLEWTWDPDSTDTWYLADFAYLLRDADEVRAEHDRHVLGLFARDHWRRTFVQVGFRDVDVQPGPEGTEAFLATR